MNRRDIEAELSTTGARELLTSTSAAHLAYIGKDGIPAGDSGRVLLDRRSGCGRLATTSPKVAAFRLARTLP